MSVGIIIATVMFCFYLYQYIEEKKQKEAEEDQFFNELMNSANNQVEDKKVERCLDERTTTGLIQSTLRKIGCEFETEVKSNLIWILFTYQGENFTIECRDDSYYINVFDTWWYQISIYSDVEDIANLHRTINMANQYTSCTLLYTTDKEIEQIGVHSRKNMLFIKEIPELDKYLTGVLNEFFKVQRLVLTELEKCNVVENK